MEWDLNTSVIKEDIKKQKIKLQNIITNKIMGSTGYHHYLHITWPTSCTMSYSRDGGYSYKDDGKI